MLDRTTVPAPLPRKRDSLRDRRVWILLAIGTGIGAGGVQQLCAGSAIGGIGIGIGAMLYFWAYYIHRDLLDRSLRHSKAREPIWRHR